MSEQRPMTDPLLAARDREIYTLRLDLERAKRAAGALAVDLHAAREQLAAFEANTIIVVEPTVVGGAEASPGDAVCSAAKRWAEVAEALGVEAGLPDAPRRCLDAVRGLQAAAAHHRSNYADAEIAKIRAAKTPDDEDPLTP